MINYIQGDLFQHIKPNIIIAHVCNNLGGFGKGFVVPLSKRYPFAKVAYLAWSRGGLATNLPFRLGETQWVHVDKGNDIWVANMVAQEGFEPPRPLRYKYLIKCMQNVADLALDKEKEILAPMFGSGLAGGNWEIIEELIDGLWVDKGIKVTIFQL